jgi:outer membrane cobalamin receptor
MNLLGKFLLFLAALALNGFCRKVSAQEKLVFSGTVLQAENESPVPLVGIFENKQLLAKTDSNGKFTVELKAGKHQLKFSCIGYNTFSQYLDIHDNISTIKILLKTENNLLNQFIVAASRTPTQLTKEVSSVHLIQPYLISNTNSVDLAEVMNKVPGIAVIDGQASMRGGAGYSYNTGSRVAVLLDDMPLMGGDLADVMWNFLPIESAEQIEVIKGSASVLYGSSAMNGTINLRTGWPSQKPVTKVSFYQGVFSDPNRKATIWWDRNSSPAQNGAFFSHKQKFGKFDLVWCGNIHDNKSYLYGADVLRFRNYIKTRYRLNDKLSFGVNANFMLDRSGKFFLWNDADSGALKPFNNYIAQDVYRVFSFDPHFDYVTKHQAHALKLRLYQIHRFVDPIKFPGNNDVIANLYAFDYNYKVSISPQLHITTGTYNTLTWAQSNVFRGDFWGYSLAIYGQADYQYKNLTLLTGGRFEQNSLSSTTQNTGLLKRFGINYKIGNQTFLRANYSEGFRFPSISEKYIEDSVSSVRIFSNSKLVSEKGWTAEIGLKQGFSLGRFNALFDLSIFNQDFDSMIEYQFAQWIKPREHPEIDFMRTFGFKAQNIGQTRIAGYELTLSGEGKIGPVLLRVLGGYTYSFPVNLSKNADLRNTGNYLNAFISNMGALDSAQYYTSILTYRNRQLGKLDLDATYKKFNLGYNYQYFSVFEKYDEYVAFLPGVYDFMKRSGLGTSIHSIRFGYQPNDLMRISFLVNNLTNAEYALRPGKMDAPRLFSIQLKIQF